jgi:predicted PurR-regulated permease PerM
MQETAGRTDTALARWSYRASIATATVAALAVLHFARNALVPVIVAAVISLMLSTVVDTLVRRRVPRWLGAALVVLALVVTAGVCLNAVWEPAREWLDRAPHMLQTAERKLRPVTRLVAKVESVSDQAARMASPPKPGGSEPPLQVRDGPKGLVNLTMDWVVATLATVFLTYFLLANGPELLARLSRPSTAPGRSSPTRVVLDVRKVLARYFGALALSSLVLGLATSATMFALHMPSPPLWGTLAFLLNFIPYAGPTVTFSLLVLVALVSFDGVAPAATVGSCFLLLTTLEGQLLQPILVGRRIRVNPAAVLLALWWGGWLWGLPGVALAMPILAIARAVVSATRQERRVPREERGTDVQPLEARAT